MNGDATQIQPQFCSRFFAHMVMALFLMFTVAAGTASLADDKLSISTMCGKSKVGIFCEKMNAGRCVKSKIEIEFNKKIKIIPPSEKNTVAIRHPDYPGRDPM